MSSRSAPHSYSDRKIPWWKEPLLLILTGWKIIFSELKWVCIKTCRVWEIKQLEKRLQQELYYLGKCVFHQTRGGSTQIDLQDPETDLALKQISFLEEEISHLKEELNKTREEFINKRCGSTA